MKKYIISLLLISLMASCVNDGNDFVSLHETGTHSLFAEIEQNETAVTRMTVSDDNRVSWEQTDQIGVFGTTSENELFACRQLNGDVATFTGNLANSGEEVVFAYYPYQKEARRSGSSFYLELPAVYVYTGNSNAPMMAFGGTDGQLAFKHLCGLMRITLDDLPADAESFVIASSGDDPSPIAGMAWVEDVNAPDAVLRIQGGGNRTIVYQLKDLAANTGLRHFFVPLPVGTYSNLEVSLYGKGKTEPYFTRSVSNVSIRRAGILNMPVLNGETGECYVLGSNVREISEELSKSITVSGADGDVLTYKGDVNEEDIPQVGQVVISKAYEQVPYGFLGKVTEVKKDANGDYLVLTEHAALDEAFDQLYVDEEIAVSLEEEDEAQTRWFLKDQIFAGDAEFAKVLGVEYKEELSHFYANGTIGLGGRFGAYIHIDKERKLNNLSLTFVSDVSMELGMGINFKSEGKLEGAKLKLGELKLARIPLAAGVIQLFPTLTPYFEMSAEGNITNTIGAQAEFQHFSGVSYKDGVWEAGSNRSKNKSNQESPWNFQGHLTFDGELFVGLTTECDLRLYNRKDARIYLKPEIGLSIEGELDINEQNKASWENILTDAKLASSLYAAGSLGVDASILSSGELGGELEIARFTFWEKEISVLPAFKGLLAKVRKEKKEEAADMFEADVNTELTGEVLSKDMKVELVMVDKTGKEIATTEPIAYNGGKTREEDPDVVVPMEEKFSGLPPETEYEVFPRVTSPLFKEITESGSLDLKKQSIGVDTHNSIRDVLVRIYKECGGKDWECQENWCTDAPVSEWEGVWLMEDGTYVFHFMQLNMKSMTGTFTIIDCDEHIILTSCGYFEECRVAGLHLENCPNLGFENNVSASFPNLKSAYIDNIKIEDTYQIYDYQDFTFTHFDGQVDVYTNAHASPDKVTLLFGGENLETVHVRNCSGNLNAVRFGVCPNIKSITCENLTFNDLSRENIVIRTELGIGNELKLESSCPKLEDLKLMNISGIRYCWIANCPALNHVQVENFQVVKPANCLETSKEAAFKQCTINVLEAKNVDVVLGQNSYDEAYRYSSTVNTLLMENGRLICREAVIESADIKDGTLEYIIDDDSNGEGLSLRTLSMERSGFHMRMTDDYHQESPIYFNWIKGLQSVNLYDCHIGRKNISFNGCSDLVSLVASYGSWGINLYDMPKEGCVDIRNTPSLKHCELTRLSCLTQLLFDSHFNYVEASCYSCFDLLQMIPDFYEPQGNGYFGHDARYQYTEVWNESTHQSEIEVTDRGYGWWYPGEPESLIHGRTE